jgi:quaternary ammonium compound-resistance protein SugE
MNWVFLLVAGVFEIGWALGLKLSQTISIKAYGIVLIIISMSLSVLFLWIAQKTIPIGTAYAVWTGIGAVGTFIVGIIVFKEPADVFRVLFVLFIVIGVIGLKLSHQ